MSLTFRNLRVGSLLIAVACSLMTAPISKLNADIIDVDRSGVDPAFTEAFANAEAFWESRIQNYSTNMPPYLRESLTKLRIVATSPPIDGPGGILGQAGPTSTATYFAGGLVANRPDVRSFWIVPVTSTMEFDIDDLATLAAEGTLQDVVIHEMAHALGFGSLWMQNELIAPLGGIGLMQYVGGEYAIREYGKEIGSPVVSFVPLEQRGGPGTALGHWTDSPPFFNQVFTGPFLKEQMTGFLGDFDPDTQTLVFATRFTSEATWGAMADLGYEVAGINDNAVDPPPGSRRNPPSGSVGFDLVNIKVVTRRSLDDLGGQNTAVGSTDENDPYRLRSQRWVK